MDLGAMTYIDLESDMACTKQPLTTELEELGAYLHPVTWIS